MTVGGKLKFKGSKSTTSKKIQKIDNDGCSKLMMASNIADQKSEKSNISISDNGDKKSLIFMTDAQKRHQEKRMAVEEKELKKFIKTTHRDRIESFNARLGESERPVDKIIIL